uniref:Centriolar and ciliogenesis-associated protein HYLS1 C-terminal domain-containing protein n=1 Tax=Hemiselmis andersenii TaxID=464988 RepID=A0A6U5BMD7_HEMAN
MSTPLSVTMEQVRKHLDDLGYTDVPAQVLADFTTELAARVAGSAEMSDLPQENPNQGPLRPRTASETNRFVRKRGTRVGGKPAETTARDAVDSAERGRGSGEENFDVRQVAGGMLRMEGSMAGCVRSVGSSSFIRPQTTSTGRPKRSDPVAAYQRVKDEWRDCPSVTGSKKASAPHVASIAKPKDKQIWKSQHPLNNSEGTDRSYVVPSMKPRVKEMCQVRDSLKWNEVYQPRKTDRVLANEAVRSYVTPDEKRRDDVRWQTRVMMNSAS